MNLSQVKKDPQKRSPGMDFDYLMSNKPDVLFCQWKTDIDAYSNDPCLCCLLYQSRLNALEEYFRGQKQSLPEAAVWQYKCVLPILKGIVKKECNVLYDRLHASLNNRETPPVKGVKRKSAGEGVALVSAATMTGSVYTPMVSVMVSADAQSGAWASYPVLVHFPYTGQPGLSPPCGIASAQPASLFGYPAAEGNGVGTGPPVAAHIAHEDDRQAPQKRKRRRKNADNEGKHVPKTTDDGTMATEGKQQPAESRDSGMEMPPAAPEGVTQEQCLSVFEQVPDLSACTDLFPDIDLIMGAPMEGGALFPLEDYGQLDCAPLLPLCTAPTVLPQAPLAEGIPVPSGTRSNFIEEKRLRKREHEKSVRKDKMKAKEMVGIRGKLSVRPEEENGIYLPVVGKYLPNPVVLQIMDFFGYEDVEDEHGVPRNALFLLRSVSKGFARIVHMYPGIWALNKIDIGFVGDDLKLRTPSSTAEGLRVRTSRWIKRMILFHAYTELSAEQLVQSNALPINCDMAYDLVELSRAVLPSILVDRISNRLRVENNKKPIVHRNTSMINLLDYFIDYKADTVTKKRWGSFTMKRSAPRTSTSSDNSDVEVNVFRRMMERCSDVEICCECTERGETRTLHNVSFFQMTNLSKGLLPGFSFRVNVKLNRLWARKEELVNKILTSLRDKYRLQLDLAEVDAAFLSDPSRYKNIHGWS